MDTTIFFIISAIGATITALVIARLFHEKRFSQQTALRLIAQEKLGDTFKKENQKLTAQIAELSQRHDTLKEALDLKQQELQQSQKLIIKEISEFIEQTQIKDIMTSHVVSIHCDSPFSHVPRKMDEHDIRHLPVLNDDGKLVGLISQRMLYQIRSPRKLIDGEWFYDDEMLNDVILKHVMDKDVFTLYPDQSLGKAIMKMTYSKCGCIPIVDHDHHLIGIVTRKNIIKIMASMYEKKNGPSNT